MKCVKHIETGKIMRVSDKIANKHVYLGGWKFIPKQEWKDKVRRSTPPMSIAQPRRQNVRERLLAFQRQRASQRGQRQGETTG